MVAYDKAVLPTEAYNSKAEDKTAVTQAMVRDINALANMVDATKHQIRNVNNSIIGPRGPEKSQGAETIRGVPMDLLSAINYLREEIEALRAEVERVF